MLNLQRTWLPLLGRREVYPSKWYTDAVQVVLLLSAPHWEVNSRRPDLDSTVRIWIKLPWIIPLSKKIKWNIVIVVTKDVNMDQILNVRTAIVWNSRQLATKEKILFNLRCRKLGQTNFFRTDQILSVSQLLTRHHTKLGQSKCSWTIKTARFSLRLLLLPRDRALFLLFVCTLDTIWFLLVVCSRMLHNSYWYCSLSFRGQILESTEVCSFQLSTVVILATAMLTSKCTWPSWIMDAQAMPTFADIGSFYHSLFQLSCN